MRNFSLLTGEKIIRSILSVLVGAWVLRYLGPEQSGSITYIAANILILLSVAKLGLDPIIVRDVNLKPEQRGVLLGTALFLQAVVCLVIFCVWISVELTIKQPRLDMLLALILSLLLVAQPLEVFEWWFLGTGQIDKPVFARITALIVITVLRICAILSGFGILVFSAFQVVDEWLSSALIYFFFRRGSVPKLTATGECAKTLLRESWPYFFGGLAITIYMRIDQVMLGAMLNRRSVGIFYAAVTLSNALVFLPLAISTSIFPVLTRLKQENEARYERIIINYCNLTFAYSLLITVVIWLLGPFLISILFGARYAESTDVLRTYILGFSFVSSGVAQSAWFINNRRGDVLLKKSVSGLIVNVLLNLYLIPRFGPNGAAWSTVVSQFVAVFGTNFVFDRRFVAMQTRSITGWLLRLSRA